MNKLQIGFSMALVSGSGERREEIFNYSLLFKTSPFWHVSALQKCFFLKLAPGWAEIFPSGPELPFQTVTNKESKEVLLLLSSK